MDTNTVVLEYLKVILSPQLVTGAIGLIFVVLFFKQIRGLFGRLATIKFPGGEISVTQAEKAKGESSEDKRPVLSPEGSTVLPATLNLSEDQVVKVRQLFEAERANAYLWEYRFLNYYLVLNTQRVLDWLASVAQSPSLSFFDSFWQPLIPSPQERRAIISALEQHHLIQLTGELVEITPKGREYNAWRGPLPQAATPLS